MMKDLLKNTFSNPIYVCGGIFLFSGGALVFALVMQYVFGLAPCDLCIWQRIPLVVTGLLGLVGLIAAYNPDRLKIAALATFLSGLGFFTGSGIAFYHHGVEQHWWRSFLQGCTVELPADPTAFLDFIQNNQAVPCDQIPWAFLGLSMAAWNALISPLIGVACVIAAILLARRANNFI